MGVQTRIPLLRFNGICLGAGTLILPSEAAKVVTKPQIQLETGSANHRVPAGVSEPATPSGDYVVQ